MSSCSETALLPEIPALLPHKRRGHGPSYKSQAAGPLHPAAIVPPLLRAYGPLLKFPIDDSSSHPPAQAGKARRLGRHQQHSLNVPPLVFSYCPLRGPNSNADSFNLPAQAGKARRPGRRQQRSRRSCLTTRRRPRSC